MSESWSEPYEEHIKRHHLPILDGRVSLRTDVPIIRDGGYADVHMGTLTSDDVGSFQEDVAVKMVRGRSINPSHIKKFLQEAHTWSKLNHEHILPLLGITLKLDDSLSIISPWMANGSAKKYVNLDPSRDPRPLLKDVATGLHYLHTRPKKVYHGDLKGENIMVSNDGRAILADFGFSALDGSSSFSLPITHPTGGTQKWTAPEKLAGKGDSVAADMYSFAMVTVELFTRKDPFEGERGLSLQALQNGKRPARPTPDLTYDRFTDNWWTLCRLCWHGEPSERWTSTEVLDFLGKIESPRTILPLAGVGQEILNNPINMTFIRKEEAGYIQRAQILLAVAPEEPISNDAAAIVWKILTLDGSNWEETITWTGSFGFSTTSQRDDDTIIPESGVVVQMGQVVSLASVAGKLDWSTPEVGNDHQQVKASNNSFLPVSLALFAVNDSDTYSPIIHLGRLRPGASVSTGIPVKLQAYVASGSKVYKEGQVIEKQDLLLPLFTSHEGVPEPCDLRTLPKDIEFAITTHSSGRLILSAIQA